MVEGLTSYITRLARAHCVTPGSLFSRVVAPMANSCQRGLSTHSRVRAPTLSMNGCNELAETVVNALHTLTRYSNLRLLTLLDWRGALSQNKLVRTTQAWCPHCYEDWLSVGAPLFQPLFWSIQAVTVCDIHKSALRLHCPTCRRAVGPAGVYCQPGCCTKCSAWLGEPVYPQLNDLRELPYNPVAERITFQVKELISTIDRLLTGQIADHLRYLVKSSRCRSVTSFGRAIGIVPKPMYELVVSRCLPSISQLVTICAATDVSLKQLLTGGLDCGVVIKVAKDRVRRPNGLGKEAAHQRLSAALASALAQYPPVGIAHVAYATGHSIQYIQKTFPTEVAEIRQKLKQYLKERKCRIERPLIEALKSPNPPTLRTLASEIGCRSNYISKNYPDLSRKLQDRRKALRYQVLMTESKRLSNEIRSRALILNERSEYPSVRRVLRDLGVKRTRTTDALTLKVLREVRMELGIPTVRIGK